MDKINVDLHARSYNIIIGEGLFGHIESFKPLTVDEQVLIVTNETVAPLYLEQVRNTLQTSQIKVDTVILPDGEQHKSLGTLDLIFTALLRKPHSRKTTLLALGGGVIGDITGFAAACYQRGVRFIQLPTTLLAQVDSSVGGKTAVNHPLGKNMIGAFYQPAAVVIDLKSLKTLPKREFSAGLAEVIKYGVILDEAFFNWLEVNIKRLMMLDKTALSYCIRRCCEIKAEVVTQDEKEHGLRTLLNLGHTYGHAIETLLGYGSWLHGEAIAVGMMMAAQIACNLQLFSQESMERLERLLQAAHLPTYAPESILPDDYLPLMLRDKKAVTGTLRLVLPVKLGEAIVVDNISRDEVIKSITQWSR